MLKLYNLKAPKGSRHRKKILGRGRSHGQGATAGRGMKGQLSRRGEGKKPGFEGGQTPLIRRLPKFGFRHKKKFDIKAFNIQQIFRIAEKYNISEINPQVLKEYGYMKKNQKLKVLGVAPAELKTELKKISTDFISQGALKFLESKNILVECPK